MKERSAIKPCARFKRAGIEMQGGAGGGCRRLVARALLVHVYVHQVMIVES
jgi:hypothetical protein